MSGTRVAGWFSRWVAWKADPFLMRITRGRVSSGGLLPTALLETRGARTGKPRRNAVIYFHDAADVIVVASKLGLPEHPSWYFNARANPDVLLNDEPFRAQVVEPVAERDRLWAMADRVFPPFAVYRERAARAGRTIPVLRLSARPPDTRSGSRTSSTPRSSASARSPGS